MRQTFVISIALILLLVTNCKRQVTSLLSFDNTQRQIIAFQPIYNFDDQELEFIRMEISRFYNKPVIILKAIGIPQTYFSPIINKYSADSIVLKLSELQNEKIVEIVGLIHDPIYTLKKYKNIPEPYYDQGILGLGYLPGNSCVISDYAIRKYGPASYIKRMRIVIIHEIGHNMGLSHCTDKSCIMSEANGDISTPESGGKDYCDECKRKLKVYNRIVK